MSSGSNVDNFFRQVLPNGLKVIFEKRDIPTVSVIAATQFGSAYESEKVKGLAHLIEHTAFKRTKTKNTEQINSMVEKKGGEINAFTSEEITAFYAKIKAEHFEIAMDVVSDVMMNPVFLKKDIDMEKKVILEEIKLYKDSPRKHVLTKLHEQLYASPFGMSTLGTPESIKSLTKATIQKYHNVFYNPSNITLAVVGKADVDKIWNFSKKDFAKKNVQKQIDKMGKMAIQPGPFGNYVEKRKGIDQVHAAIGYTIPGLKDPNRYAAEIMNVMLGVGSSSRLHMQIRENKGLAYQVNSFINQGMNYGNGCIYLGTDKNKYNSAIKLAIAELKKMKKVEQKDVEEAKEQLIGQYALENEDTEKTALGLLKYEIEGDAKNYYQYAERIAAVKFEDVRTVADITKMATALIIPE